MESGFNRSMESRQRIAFGMGWIHERFPAVPSGLKVSSGVMTVDKALSAYHVQAEARMAQIREEISSYLKGDILISLDSVTESISGAEKELSDILNMAKDLLESETGMVIPDEDKMRITAAIERSEESLKTIEKERSSWADKIFI